MDMTVDELVSELRDAVFARWVAERGRAQAEAGRAELLAMVERLQAGAAAEASADVARFAALTAAEQVELLRLRDELAALDPAALGFAGGLARWCRANLAGDAMPLVETVEVLLRLVVAVGLAQGGDGATNVDVALEDIAASLAPGGGETDR